MPRKASHALPSSQRSNTLMRPGSDGIGGEELEASEATPPPPEPLVDHLPTPVQVAVSLRRIEVDGARPR